jgi:hypothetical protein
MGAPRQEAGPFGSVPIREIRGQLTHTTRSAEYYDGALDYLRGLGIPVVG